MKKWWVLTVTVVVMQISIASVASAITNASNSESQLHIVASLAEAKATLYAMEREGTYEKFKLDIDGIIRFFPDWKNVNNPSVAPRLFFKDLNHDAKKELIIVLTKCYGTGVLDTEVHVFHLIETNKGEGYEEMLVDKPMSIILKNVKTKLTPHEAVVTVGDKKNVVNIDKFQISHENLFSDVAFGNIVKFDIVDNQLLVSVPGQISPASFIGTIVITYEYKDMMYLAKKVEFGNVPEDEIYGEVQ